MNNNENLKQMVNSTIRLLEKNSLCEDKQKIQYLSNELKKIEKKIPTYEKMEELQKVVIDLEVKYDSLNDLSYYFDPLYVKIMNTIHQEKVKKLREENRKKREKN